MSYVSKFTTKERIKHYSGVKVEDIDDFVVEDADDWVQGELRKHGIDPTTILPTQNSFPKLRQAATWMAIHLLNMEGGGKKNKINETQMTNSGVGEINVSLQGTQTTGEELPTSDWYVEAQRAMAAFLDDAADPTRKSTNKFKAFGGSTIERVNNSNYHTSGMEDDTLGNRFGDC